MLLCQQPPFDLLNGFGVSFGAFQELPQDLPHQEDLDEFPCLAVSQSFTAFSRWLPKILLANLGLEPFWALPRHANALDRL